MWRNLIKKGHRLRPPSSQPLLRGFFACQFFLSIFPVSIWYHKWIFDVHSLSCNNVCPKRWASAWMNVWRATQLPSLLIWMWCKSRFPSRSQTCDQTNKDFSIALASFRMGKTTSPCNLLDLQRQPPLRALRGWTSLHLAAEKGHDSVVQRLLAAGAAVDAVENYGHGLRRGIFRGGSCEWQGWEGEMMMERKWMLRREIVFFGVVSFLGRDSEGSGYARSIMSDFLPWFFMEVKIEVPCMPS